MLRKAVALAAATSSVAAYSGQGYETSNHVLAQRDLGNALLERRLNYKRDLYSGAIHHDDSELYVREAEAAPFLDTSSAPSASSTTSINTGRGINSKSTQSNDKTPADRPASKPTKYICEGKLVISHPESTMVKRDLDENDLSYGLYAREAEAYNSYDPSFIAESKSKAKATAFVCHGSMTPAPPKAKRDMYEDDFVSYGLYARDAEPEASPVVPVPDPHANLADQHKIAIYNAVMLDRQKSDAKAQAATPAGNQANAASNKATVRTAGRPKARRDNFDEEMMYDLFARDAEPEAEAAAPAPAPAKPLPAIMPYVPLKAAPNAKPASPPAAKAAPPPVAAKQAAAKPAPARPKRSIEFDNDEFSSTLYARDAEPEARRVVSRVISKVPWKQIGKGAMNGAVNAATQASYSQPAPVPLQDQSQNSPPQGNDLSPVSADASNQSNSNIGGVGNFNNYNRRSVDYSAEDTFPFALYSRDADSGDDRDILEYKARLADLQAKYAHLQLEEADGKAPTVHSRDVDGGSVSYSSDWFARDALPEGDFDVEFAELLARDLENGELFEREAEPEMSEYEALFEPEIWF